MNALLNGKHPALRNAPRICLIQKPVAVSRKGFGVIVGGAQGVQLMPVLLVVATFRDGSFDASLKPVIFSLS